MDHIHYIDRVTQHIECESVYGEGAIRFLYGKGLLQRIFGKIALYLVVQWPWFSYLYGLMQKCTFSKRKVLPFIKKYQLDTSEFEKKPKDFTSFNDFFIRHLIPSARPIQGGKEDVIIPADGRYLVFDNINMDTIFPVKGKHYSIRDLLQSKEAARYDGGSLVMGRLCPIDCHRFFFPCDGIAGIPTKVKGKLFSVNPIATKRNPWIYFENKRYVTFIDSTHFGKVAYLEVGATSVGTVHQTYTPGLPCLKGQEKGYFSFGGSLLIILFEKGKIQFDEDLLTATKNKLETRCLIGQRLGKKVMKK